MQASGSSLAAGGRSGTWAGRAGKETGALHMIHSGSQVTEQRMYHSHQAHQMHAGAAGAACGASYEVVPKGYSSRYARTAPFANDAPEWKQSVARHSSGQSYMKPDAMGRVEFVGTLHRVAGLVLNHPAGVATIAQLHGASSRASTPPS
mmetsp:Transcript_50307/g.144706  ORF Transcript_50307/g.144706 Transcript_50307/m.144706 type:complete len:149 (-) Transcript_50307:55-501(-)